MIPVNVKKLMAKKVLKKTKLKKELSLQDSLLVDIKSRFALASSSVKKVDYRKVFSNKNIVLLAVFLILVQLLWRNKNLLVAATVNGQPIPRWTLESRLVSRYGAQTLEEVINEVLIRQAGAKKGVSVSAKDVDNKIAEIEKSLDGKISVADALAQQGMTMAEFRSQVELQLILDKLAINLIDVSDQEVADYIASNSANLVSTELASQSAEAKTILTSQKKNAAYRQIFDDLKKQAKVSKLL